jgi:hypothetical protein
VPDVHDSEIEVEAAPPIRWVTGAIYTALLAANLYLVFDWWRDTPQGEAVIERCRARMERAKALAGECEGCAQRRAWLQKQLNRMHWQAERIVEGDEVETQPDQP